MGNESKPHRNLQLDLLRFVAVILVFFRHTLEWEYAPVPLSALLRGGWAGVDLFFVLSGFLIGGLLLLEYKRWGRIQLSRFYTRRALRLYPAFYLMIVPTIVAHWFGIGGQPDSWNAIAGELLFLQNYLGTIRGYTWSLAVEEHFYILLPLTLVFLSWRAARRVRQIDAQFNTTKLDSLAPIADPFRSLPWIYVVVAIATLILRFFTIRNAPFPRVPPLHPTHLRLDSLLCGVVLAYFYHFRPAKFLHLTKRYRWTLIAIGIGAYCLPMMISIEESKAMFVVGLPILSLGGGALLCGLLAVKVPLNPIVRAIAFIGGFSYSIYLFHLPMFSLGAAIARRLPGQIMHNLILGALVQHAAAIIGGMLIGWLIEFPVLRLRDRYFPSRTGAPVTASGRHGTVRQSTESPTSDPRHVAAN